MSLISIKDFNEIEDIELKKWVYTHIRVQQPHKTYKIDNDEKIGYYYASESIKASGKGTFYRKSSLIEWVVYNKKTKKVTMSPTNKNCYEAILKEKFRFPKLIQETMHFPKRMFYKLLITDKIKTVADVVKYYRSYSIKMPHLPIGVVFEYMRSHKLDYVHAFEDPEEVVKKNLLKDIELSSEFLIIKPFKLKTSELGKWEDVYDEWKNIQREKYVAFKGSRVESARVGNSGGRVYKMESNGDSVFVA